ncbi:Uncharacterised protein [Escherichia coli]|nr:Uncharacterised protein [Escherichia coli]
MDAVLSVQGASAPSKRSRFFQIHSSEYARLVRAVLPLLF